jgi:hypothetical protein
MTRPNPYTKATKALENAREEIGRVAADLGEDLPPALAEQLATAENWLDAHAGTIRTLELGQTWTAARAGDVLRSAFGDRVRPWGPEQIEGAAVAWAIDLAGGGVAVVKPRVEFSHEPREGYGIGVYGSGDGTGRPATLLHADDDADLLAKLDLLEPAEADPDAEVDAPAETVPAP